LTAPTRWHLLTAPMPQALLDQPVLQAFVALSILAIGILIAGLVRRAALALNVEEFLVQINKLVAAGNADRALKLCDAAAPRPVGILIRAGLAAWLGENLEPGAQLERAKMAMGQQLPLLLASTGPSLILAAVASACVTALGAVALVLSPDPQTWPVVGGGIALVDVLTVVSVLSIIGRRNELTKAVREFGRGTLAR
jgi:hypothetical protein